MPADEPETDRLFETRWVHVFEEDTPAGSVFRPDTTAIPLSRRPRRQFELRQDGSARLFGAGPDDRFVEQAATWKADNDGVVVRSSRGDHEIRIVDRSAARLIVRTAGSGAW